MGTLVKFRLKNHQGAWIVKYADNRGHSCATPDQITLWKEVQRLRALVGEPLDTFVTIVREDEWDIKLQQGRL